MKYTIKHLASIAIALVVATGVSAQNTLNSSYFMEKMTKRNQLNPALKTPNNYVSMPVLSNFYLGVNSNLGLGTFLYPRDNKLVTFLHESVPADEFLGKLANDNALELDLGLDIISFGFWAWGGQNTFNLALKSNTGAYLPKELFQFLKTGQEPTGVTHYDMSNVTVASNNYLELAFGHARDITDKLGVGARVKVLLGAAHAEARIDRMDITMSQDEWIIKQAGHLQASSLLNLTTDPETGEITNYKLGNNFGLAGFGLGFDLGATYKLIDNLTLSAALTDIGFMRWNNLSRAETDPNKEFRFSGFDNIGAKDDENGDNPFKKEADQLGEDLKALTKFYKTDARSVSNSLRTTLRVGAEYAVLDNAISFGLLSTTRFVGYRTYAEGMAAINFRPLSALHLTVNGSVSNMGSSVGAILNICAPGFNFFVGTDYFATQYSKQFIPINHARANLSFGFNITFGEKHKI
ncbi:DUF5723 family protein [Barnesiella sp. An55]|uniref:DUF5723 family protein n=1 Tax=Barnesiella sp. An55 TaxID=1965646 RepID=UPI000B393684|nr:DUF5723 family protein [Barnesiella sp. An55]OUN69984.1 hypothetical protein B5G10_10840 [Barnesiella sp. An55]HIZ27461.1 hypothetical protein [Candidatus Barnesiella merdipullorum]